MSRWYNYELGVQIAIRAPYIIIIMCEYYRPYFDEDTDYECEYAHQLHIEFTTVTLSCYHNKVQWNYVS